jgi:hypothetical protein
MTQAQLQQLSGDTAKFARCMRSHGVSNWPDPTVDSSGRLEYNLQAAGIAVDGHGAPISPQIRAKAHECEHVFPASLAVPPGA